VIRALSNEPVNGRWLLTGLAGRGSSATVYRAFDLVDERLVAIKSLGERGSPAHLCRRARREFLGMSSLRHPHLVESYEYGEAGSGPLAPGSPFFTMELLEGADLGGRGAAGVRRLARAALGLLAALECVHGHGLVHGDVKPSNVFADARGEAEGRIKLGDLGLARRPRPAPGDGRLTGTLHYAAPERIAGGPADGRSDLYSLGVSSTKRPPAASPFDEADPAAALGLAPARRRRRPRTTRPRCLPPRARDRPPGANARPRSVPRARGRRGRRSPSRRRLLRGARERRRVRGPLVDAPREGAHRSMARRARRGGGLARDRGTFRIRYLAPRPRAAQAGRARGWSVHAWTCRREDPPFAPLGRPLREIILRECGPSSRRSPSEGEVLALLGGPALWSAPDRLVALAGPPLAGAIAAFLAARGAGVPRLLVLDDADRLDAASALVLRALAETGTGATRGLLVVAAAHMAAGSPPSRSGEGSTDDPDPGADVRPFRAARARTLSTIRPHLARHSGVRNGPTPACSHPARGPIVASPAGAAPARETIFVGELTEAQSRRLIAALPGIGALTAREVDGIVRAAHGMPGRLARMARAMAGRQLALFPPLCDRAAADARADRIPRSVPPG
jgi:serine/threonine protein kinase